MRAVMVTAAWGPGLEGREQARPWRETVTVRICTREPENKILPQSLAPGVTPPPEEHAKQLPEKATSERERGALSTSSVSSLVPLDDSTDG